MKMLRLAIPALFAAAAFAQNAGDLFNKAPADVDQALRARINEFYQDHVTRQYRKAEDLVAEDTKDYYYTHDKPAYLGFEIKEIHYNEDFTKAKATVLCEQRVMFIGFADKPVKIPTPSYWKLENGKWCWYVDQDELRNSPFGKMTAGTTPSSAPVPTSIPTNYDFVLNQVKADKEEIALKAGQTGQVTIANAAPGTMHLTLVGQVPGVEAKLESGEVAAGGKVALKLQAGKNAGSGLLVIRVEQTGETIPVRVKVN